MWKGFFACPSPVYSGPAELIPARPYPADANTAESDTKPRASVPSIARAKHNQSQPSRAEPNPQEQL